VVTLVTAKKKTSSSRSAQQIFCEDPVTKTMTSIKSGDKSIASIRSLLYLSPLSPKSPEKICMLEKLLIYSETELKFAVLAVPDAPNHFGRRLSEILSLYHRRPRDVPRCTFRRLNRAGWYTEYGKYTIFQVAVKIFFKQYCK